VFAYRLSDQKLLLRIRREPDPTQLIQGGMPTLDRKAEASRLRQIRSCALGSEVKALANQGK
jgi:hypothetical protein